MRRSLIVYFILFFITVSLIGGSVLTTYSQFVADGPLDSRKEIVIPAGKSVKQIAFLLKEQGFIDSSSIFELGVRAYGNANKLQAGEFSIPAHASAKIIMNLLTSGNTYVRRVVIPEGLTSAAVVKLVDDAYGLKGEILNTPKNGTLLPETYYYSLGDTKESIIIRMQLAMQRAIDEAWNNKADNIPLNSKEEAVILASIVEKETARSSERPLVAAVFTNRLNKKMKLQSDPTVIYAITEGTMELKRKLLLKDLKKKHPFNTYVIQGLPPAPIGNPGLESIKAVLNPPKTEDLYFVADGTGGHTFSKTYSTHRKNVQEWYSLKKQKSKKTNIPKTAETALTVQGKTEKNKSPETAADTQDFTLKTPLNVSNKKE